MSKLLAQRALFPRIVSFVIILVAVAATALISVRHASSGQDRSSAGAGASQGVAPVSPSSVTPAARAQIEAHYAALPLAFEANEGQTDPQVKYLARGNGYTLFLTPADAVFAFESEGQRHRSAGDRVSQVSEAKNGHPHARDANLTSVVRMRLVGGKAQPRAMHGEKLAGVTNYFVGNDPTKWHSNVPQYSSVSYEDVYPGIKMVFHGQQRQLEFDFVVASGADPARIALGFSGAQKLSTDRQGNLILASAAGSLLLHKPVAYQEENGARRLVEAGFVLKARNEVGLQLSSYDRTRELIIDPSVTYATYLGGTAEDDAYAIAIDSSGNAYVTGQTKSANFPTVPGGLSIGNAGGFDAFVTELSADGSRLMFSTYIGGSNDDSGNAIALDASNNVYVAGGTKSSNFPTTPSAFQTKFGGGSVDAFVLELSSTGSPLIYSTYLGGSGDDVAIGIAIDATGAYVVGSTTSTNFPVLAALQPAIVGSSNGFVTKLGTTGSALVYSTYLGGGTGDVANAVAVDSAGNAYVTGATQNPTFPVKNAFQATCGTDGKCNGGLDDAFVSVINSAGSGFKYSTFLGGSGVDVGLGIAVDASQNAYVTGSTGSSTDFKLSNPQQLKYGGGITDAFVSVFKPSGSALIYSTYLGGSQNDIGTSIAVDGSKNVYITGQTGSSNFPLVSAVQGTIGGLNDAFVSEINSSSFMLAFSTFLGGSLNEDTSAAATGGGARVGAIAVDPTGANIYVAGNTSSTNFPTKSPFQGSSGGSGDAFVAKYVQSSTTPDFSITAAALNPGTVTQGGTATSTVTVTALNGYSKTVNLTCAVTGGGSPAPKCSLSPTSTNGGGSSTLTVTTIGVNGALLHPSRIFYAMLLPVFGLSLMGVSFSYAGSGRKKLLGFLLLGVVICAVFFLPACGSSSGGGCTGCTPKGTYAVTVTGKDGNLTHSVSPALTLTVN